MAGNEFADLVFFGIGPTEFGGPTPAIFEGDSVLPMQALDIREGSILGDISGDGSGFDTKTIPTSTVSVGVVTQQKYRMRGYRVATSQYEIWITTDPTAAPPSGNSLVAIVIEARLPN